MTFGEYFRNKRIEKKMTLRAYCSRYGFDPANISKVENDKLRPPKDGEKLKALAISLELKEGSQDWITFFDLAYQANNDIPKDIKKDASEVIRMLPRFLRTNDNRKIDRKKLKELIAFLEKGGE
ncbi:MAG: hypothetical protein UR81_C0008G0015 [Candidatus Levybacteria bacterium GW2011_GWB1_35_5]|nr:MAG: hypothetical protein UR81_C0008G0015 [Candidatus Levybacteria bacterium GW2011_GWB1_35_5]